MNATGATACRACGAPLDVRNLVSESGWREAPRIRDMTEIQFNASTCQVEGDVVPVAPGLTARHSPGHTPGSYVLIVSSGTNRAYLLGDVVACPLQLTDNDISFLTDVDPALAARTRESLFRELESQQAAIGMDHFPGLEFQRILTGTGRQWATF